MTFEIDHISKMPSLPDQDNIRIKLEVFAVGICMFSLMQWNGG